MAGLYSYDVMNANLSTRCWERTAVGNITSQQGITPGANLTVLSINLSCHLPLPATRFHAFLQYIKGISPMPDIILFQEFHHQALGQLQNDEFVRNNYTISNLSTYEWGGAQQGTLAMWRRTLPIKYTGRLLLPYTASNQSVLVLDFLKSDNTVFRIVTARTELEYRDHQIAAINQYLIPGIASYSPTSALLLGDINRGEHNPIFPSSLKLI